MCSFKIYLNYNEFSPKSVDCGVCDIAQDIRLLVAKPEDLSSIPGPSGQKKRTDSL